MPDLFDIDAAFDAIEASEDRTAPICAQIDDNTRELTGRWYYEDDGIRRPLNILARNALTLGAHLCHRNGVHEATPKSVVFKAQADLRALLLDTTSDELERIKITRLQFLRAFLGPMAVTKIGARVGADLVKINGRLYDRGMPYIQEIDFTDHLADHEARCRDELKWEGHRYRVPRQVAADCGIFNPDIIMALPSTSEDTGDNRVATRPDMISKRQGTAGQEAVEMVELIDLCFYDDAEPLILTMPAARGYATDFMRVEPWQGPRRGPYEWLEFHPMPNQLYGMSLAAFMREQHEITNELFGKMVDQILRSKRLLIGPRTSSDDLDTARDAEDGDVLEFDDPQSVKNVDMGGITPDFEPFANMLLQWTNMQYVNVEVAAGSEGGTDKATIYQGMSANVNVVIDDLQNTLEEYETRVSRSLDWRLQQDPLLHKTMIRRLPGQEFIDVVYDALSREDDKSEMEIKIRYGSMLRQDPQVKASNLLQLIQIAMQSAQVSMQTQGYWSTQGCLRLAGQYLGFDELDQLVNDPALEQMVQQTISAAVGQPPQQGVPSGMSGVNPSSLRGPRVAPKAAGRSVGGGFARPQNNNGPRRQSMAGAA